MIKVKRVASLEPGVYQVTLKKVSERQRKIYQSEEMEDVITFEYLADTDQGEVTLYRDVRPVISPKSNLVLDLRAMVGERANDSILADDKEFNDLLQSLVGRPFMVQTDQTESGNTKVVKVMAPPKTKVTAVKKVVQAEDETPPPSDDDIPF